MKGSLPRMIQTAVRMPQTMTWTRGRSAALFVHAARAGAVHESAGKMDIHLL